MFKALANVTTKSDLTKQIERSLQSLGAQQVYVGIPEGDVGNHDDITNPQLMYVLTHGVRSKSMHAEMNDYMGLTPGGMPITRGFNTFLENQSKGMPYSAAYELYIHEHGSPLWQIPPRPVLEPAINNSKEIIAKQLKQAAQDALNGADPSEGLHKAGMLGVNAARDWFYNPENKWPANSPSTVKLKGSDRPNIDTGNLRNSITYVVAKKT
ncbi:hypothetical protein ACOALA_13495 [Alicyclobacillus acidoterrestris]|uniref:hypothetical protein n=1 Tax=Alicyclobacillus acidoterrestris TaxID=1450 RepID=UPI003F53CC15